MTPPYPDRRERRFREPDFRRGCRVKELSQRRPRPSTTTIHFVPLPAWFSDSAAPFSRDKAPSKNDSLHFNCWRRSILSDSPDLPNDPASFHHRTPVQSKDAEFSGGILSELKRTPALKWSESFLDGVLIPRKKGRGVGKTKLGKGRSGWWSTAAVFLGEFSLCIPRKSACERRLCDDPGRAASSPAGPAEAVGNR